MPYFIEWLSYELSELIAINYSGMSIYQDKAVEKGQQKQQAKTKQLKGVQSHSSSFQDHRSIASQEQSLQLKADLHSKATSPLQMQANRTGLPDQLKTGIEQLSGYSMDDVKVHYNSDKPAQLQAHAYAQGTNIHLAPGKEKHLPHEAWHVVQQKQGRVKPSLQMKSKGLAINDDVALEKEADQMGQKALHASPKQVQLRKKSAATADGPIQRYRESGGYMISQNDQFAVRNHGRPESEMYVRSLDLVSAIQHIRFEAGGTQTIDGVEYIRLVPRFASPEERARMEKMFCGQFSHHATGKNEAQESGDAPAGRSLYIRRIAGPASHWENHYAPVIIIDEGDRGTYETAVGLDYLFFGIYGQILTQSFAFKTEIAGILLGLEKNALGKGFQLQLEDLKRQGKPIPDYLTQAIADQERELEVAARIRDIVSGEASGSSEELEALIVQVRAHMAKRYDLAAELRKEEEERRAAEAREAARRRDRMIKIGLTTAAIVGVLTTIGVYLVKRKK